MNAISPTAARVTLPGMSWAFRPDTNISIVRMKAAMQFISEFMAAHDGVTPTFREIAAGIGLKSVSHAHRIVLALAERGYVRVTPAKRRSIEVLRFFVSLDVVEIHPDGRDAIQRLADEAGCHVRDFLIEAVERWAREKGIDAQITPATRNGRLPGKARVIFDKSNS